MRAAVSPRVTGDHLGLWIYLASVGVSTYYGMVVDMAQRLRTWLIGAVLIVIGVLVGHALPDSSVSPASEAGTITAVHGRIGSPKASLDFKGKGVKGTASYALVEPTPWQATSGAKWHSGGQPSCLKPTSPKPDKATIGVITVHGVGSAPGGPMVVWVECYG
jgi:hypothetical protein